MKKKLILFLLLPILFGCEANYSVIISKDKISEELIIMSNNEQEKQAENSVFEKAIINASSSYLPSLITDYEPEVSYKENNKKHYKVQKLDSNNEIGLKYNYDFSYQEYINSTLANLHSKISFNNYGNTINLKATIDSIFNQYPYLDKITLKATIKDYNVKENNADQNTDNNYYWYLDRNNKTKTISLILNTDSSENKSIIKDKKNDKNYNILFILIPISICCLFGILFLILKVKNSNK